MVLYFLFSISSAVDEEWWQSCKCTRTFLLKELFPRGDRGVKFWVFLIVLLTYNSHTISAHVKCTIQWFSRTCRVVWSCAFIPVGFSPAFLLIVVEAQDLFTDLGGGRYQLAYLQMRAAVPVWEPLTSLLLTEPHHSCSTGRFPLFWISSMGRFPLCAVGFMSEGRMFAGWWWGGRGGGRVQLYYFLASCLTSTWSGFSFVKLEVSVEMKWVHIQHIAGAIRVHW